MEIIKIHYNKSRPVKDWNEIKAEAEALLKFMNDSKGVFAGREGMALHHSQVTESPWDFFVASPVLLEKKLMDRQIIINARIVDSDERKLRMREGCMSFPHKQPKFVERWFNVKVEYETPKGNGLETVREKLTWPVSQMFQHEIDHAQGRNIYYES